MYAGKATQAKGAKTNIIENLNSQLRDKIAYLVEEQKLMPKVLSGWTINLLDFLYIRIYMDNRSVP